MLVMLQEFVLFCYSPNSSFISDLFHITLYLDFMSRTGIETLSKGRELSIRDHIWGMLGQCDQGQKQSNLPLDLVKKVV